MLTTDQIRKKAERLWPRLLTAHLAGEELLPYSLPLAPPGSRELAEKYSEIHHWIRVLEAFAKQHGLELMRKTVSHRRLGTQHLPHRLLIPDTPTLLKLIDRSREYHQFAENLAMTRRTLPQLEAWLPKGYRQLVTCADLWPRLLAAVSYLLAHPRPNRYLRELEIPGVDSKLIEAHIRILSQLLDHCLPQREIDHRAQGRELNGFCRRYGLKYDQPLIRFRWLDRKLPSLTLGADDLSLPITQFQALDPPLETVFITENKINGLSFPEVDKAMVIFGLGYGIEVLEPVTWLRDKKIHYWGDIDTHGLHILDRLRRFLPQTHSLLMDEQTLLASRELWGEEPFDKRYTGELNRLHGQEQQLYRNLIDNRYRENLRLEQERVPFHWLESRLLRYIDRA